MHATIIKAIWHDGGALYLTETHRLMVPVGVLPRLTLAEAARHGKAGLSRLTRAHGLKWARR